MTAQLELALGEVAEPVRRCLWCSRRLPAVALRTVRFCDARCRRRFAGAHVDEPVRGRPVENVPAGRWL